jgi:hypothetical protein
MSTINLLIVYLAEKTSSPAHKHNDHLATIIDNNPLIFGEYPPPLVDLPLIYKAAIPGLLPAKR